MESGHNMRWKRLHMAKHTMIAISGPVQFTGKMHQRFTNKIHLPAEGAATAVVLHEIVLIRAVGRSSKSLMNL
jgi:hypothetical protein